jgi:hypothetical protein
LILVDGCIGPLNRLPVKLGGLPNEVLNQVALILGKQKVLGVADHFFGVCNQNLAVLGQFLRGVADWFGGKKAVQGNIDLIVLHGLSVRASD